MTAGGLGFYLRYRDDPIDACTICGAKHPSRSMRLQRTLAGIVRVCRMCIKLGPKAQNVA